MFRLRQSLSSRSGVIRVQKPWVSNLRPHLTSLPFNLKTMFPTIILLGSALALSATATPISTCPSQIGPQGVRVRLPPSLSINPSLSWPVPPVGWYFKPWDMIYASNPQYLGFRNLQYDPTAIDPANPAGLVNDLTSFQLPGNDTIYTTYGVDTPDPRPGFPAVLQYAGTGILTGATGEYSVMAWGCDTAGILYYASYSSETALTATPAGIDIFSTSDSGPDTATTNALIAALNTITHPKIRALVATLTRMTQDGGRNGKPRVVSVFLYLCYMSHWLTVCPECRTCVMIIVRVIKI